MYPRLAVAFIAAFLALSGARAQDAQKLVLAIPPEVTEVATAGTWSDADVSGVFRATVLTLAAGDTTQAHLVLQLMSVSPDGNTSKVHKTVWVKKVADKRLPNAFLAVEEDGTENEVTWRVTSYDSNSNADVSMLVTINNKGEVEVRDAPKEEETAAQGPDKRK
ncbi:MAG TPA: hypothetical protein VE986_11320 [Hyphomicrobiales bacterium]|nr:hypothetical protein [Hyphomicrobiales bacterium]